MCSANDAVPAEVDETESQVNPVILETFSLVNVCIVAFVVFSFMITDTFYAYYY